MSAGGRIRLTSDGAELLELLLRDKEQALLKDRKIAKEAGFDIGSYNVRVELVRQVQGEILRTQTEMGWLDGQPQSTHP